MVKMNAVRVLYCQSPVPFVPFVLSEFPFGVYSDSEYYINQLLYRKGTETKEEAETPHLGVQTILMNMQGFSSKLNDQDLQD